MVQMRNMKSILIYKEMRARKPAPNSTHVATVAAWKTSTPCARYCQENTQDKSRGGSRSHMKQSLFITAARAVTTALHCLVPADL